MLSLPPRPKIPGWMAKTSLYRDLLDAEIAALDLVDCDCMFEKLAYIKAALHEAAGKYRRHLMVNDAPEDVFYHFIAAGRCARAGQHKNTLKHAQQCEALRDFIF